MSSNKKNQTLFQSKIKHPNSLENWINLTQNHPINYSETITGSDGINKKDLYSLHFNSVIVFEKIAENFSTKLNKPTSLQLSNYNHKLPGTINPENYINGQIIKFDFDKLGKCYCVVNQASCRTLINTIFNSKSTNEELTSLEYSVLAGQFESFSQLISSQWNNIFSSSDFQSSTVENDDFTDFLSSEKHIISEFKGAFQINQNQTIEIAFYYPNNFIKKLQSSSQSSEYTKNKLALTEDSQSNVSVEVKSSLGKTKLILSDILNLQVGDVVILDNALDEPINTIIGDTKIHSQVGKTKNKICIQLLDNIPEIKKEDPLFSNKSELIEKQSDPITTEPLLEEATDTLEDTELNEELELEQEDTSLDLTSNESDITETSQSNELTIDETPDNFELNDSNFSEDLNDNPDLATEELDDTENFLAEDEPIQLSEETETETDTVDDDIDDDDFSWDDLDDI